MEKSREITIKGIGNLTAKPDLVIINIELEKVNQNYANGYKQFADDMKNFRKLLKTLVFQKKN